MRKYLSASELENGPQKRGVQKIRITWVISIEFLDGDIQTVSERINAMGFGLYQVLVFIYCAGFLVAKCTCINVFAGISRAVAADYGLVSYSGKAMPMTLLFAGIGCGTLAAGPFGDAYGRRLPMFIGYTGLIFFSILIFFLPTLPLFCILCFFTGCFAGLGCPAALVMLSESAPDANRGPIIAALGIGHCFGELWAAIGLRIILPDLIHGPWRYLLLWSLIPAACFLVFGLVSPVTRYDTAHFLGARGRNGELVDAINLIARLNRCPHALELGSALKGKKDHEALRFGDAALCLSARPLALYTLILAQMFFAANLCGSGMGVFWPLAWEEAQFRLKGSTELIVTATFGIPGVAVAMVITYFLSRRLAITSAAIICAAATFTTKGLLTHHAGAFAGVVLYQVFYPTFDMVTSLCVSEIFPTQVRVYAYSIISCFGKIASILSPTIVNLSERDFLHTVSALALVSAVLAWMLKETKDCELQCLDTTRSRGADPKYGSMNEKKFKRFETCAL